MQDQTEQTQLKPDEPVDDEASQSEIRQRRDRDMSEAATAARLTSQAMEAVDVKTSQSCVRDAGDGKAILDFGVISVDPSSHTFLQRAQAEQQARAATYDAPEGERSMARTVAAFNAIYGTQLTEVQGWQFMALLKMVRAAQGAFKADNYVDQVSYGSLAGEAAAQKPG